MPRYSSASGLICTNYDSGSSHLYPMPSIPLLRVFQNLFHVPIDYFYFKLSLVFNPTTQIRLYRAVGCFMAYLPKTLHATCMELLHCLRVSRLYSLCVISTYLCCLLTPSVIDWTCWSFALVSVSQLSVGRHRKQRRKTNWSYLTGTFCLAQHLSLGAAKDCSKLWFSALWE